MPAQQALRTHLSEQISRGLPRSTFSESELLAFLSTATFDGGHIHRYIEGRRADGLGWVVDLQQTIEQFPELLLAYLRDIARMERREKRALKSYLGVTVFVKAPETAIQELLQAIELIPETPTYEAVPRFLLSGW